MDSSTSVRPVEHHGFGPGEGIETESSSYSDDLKFPDILWSPFDPSHPQIDQDLAVEFNTDIILPSSSHSDEVDAVSTISSSLPWSRKAGTTALTSNMSGSSAHEGASSIRHDHHVSSFYNFTKQHSTKGSHRDIDILSVASLDEDISSLAESNSDIQVYRETASRYIAKGLTDDSEIAALYKDAARQLNEARFIRNNRRFLKQYFLDLRHEQQLPSQKLAISFMRLRSGRTRISSEIYSLV